MNALTIYECPTHGHVEEVEHTGYGYSLCRDNRGCDHRVTEVRVYREDDVRPLVEFAEMALAVTPEGPNGMLVHKAAGKALDAFPTTDKEQACPRTR